MLFTVFLVTASTVASWLLLLPAPGLCQCSWLLRTTHRSESGSQRLSAVLCSVTVQSKSLWWGHESFQSDRWHCVSWSGVDGLLLKIFWCVWTIWHGGYHCCCSTVITSWVCQIHSPWLPTETHFQPSTSSEVVRNNGRKTAFSYVLLFLFYLTRKAPLASRWKAYTL